MKKPKRMKPVYLWAVVQQDGTLPKWWNMDKAFHTSRKMAQYQISLGYLRGCVVRVRVTDAGGRG